MAALRPPPQGAPFGSGWAGRNLHEDLVPLDSAEAAEATLMDIRDLVVALAQRGVRAVPGTMARPADYVEASSRLRSLVIQASIAQPPPTPAPAGGPVQTGRAPDGMASQLEMGSAAEKRREASVPMVRLYPLTRHEFIVKEARESATPTVMALTPAGAVARHVNMPEPVGSASFSYHFSSATTEDKASGSIPISIKGARGALVADMREQRWYGMGGELGRNLTEDHKNEVKVFFDEFIYGRIRSEELTRLYAWVMADQEHSTMQGTLAAGRPGDPTCRFDFQRAMPLAFIDMASVWGAAAGCSLGPDGVFGLRQVFNELQLRMDMPRIHAVFNDIYKGIYDAFLRCRTTNGLNYRPSELHGQGDPHRAMVGNYLRPNLVNVVKTYNAYTVEPVTKDQKESERIDFKVAAARAKDGAGPSAAATAQMQALDRQVQSMARELNAYKRGAPTPAGAPPPPPPGGPPAAQTAAQQQAAQQQAAKQQRVQPLQPVVGAQTMAGLPPPRDPGDFNALAPDPVKLVERYEWKLHQAGKPASCGWVALFDRCKNANPQAGKRPCPRCAAGGGAPDKEAFLAVAASGMSPARAAELATLKAKRGWG